MQKGIAVCIAIACLCWQDIVELGIIKSLYYYYHFFERLFVSMSALLYVVLGELCSLLLVMSTATSLAL